MNTNYEKTQHNIETLDMFRLANFNDMKEDTILYTWCYFDATVYKTTVESIINDTTFLADDGCAYDINDEFYILKSNSELVDEVERLKTVLKNIKECMGAVEV
jgi:hypothetical protein